MRLFYLDRVKDVSGVSGTGRVAEGVVFDDNSAVLRWLTKLASTAVYSNMEHLIQIHSHGGDTKITYADDPIDQPDFYPCGCPNTSKKSTFNPPGV